MIDDFRVLGIEENSDPRAIRSAYRRRAKELHPDLSGGRDSFERHALFVEVNQAYRRLIAGAKGSGPAPMASPRAGAARSRDGTRAASGAASTGGMPAVHADQAYAFYRNGMRLFSSVHPSKWNEDPRTLSTKIAGDDADQEAVMGRVAELARLLPKAYYYFSVVVHEYPDSVWAADAADKMGTIEERTGLYRRILSSFASWNADPAAAMRRYDETYGAHRRTRKSVSEEERRRWEEG